MAGIIKNQILKQLSRFAKNLSPDKIHISTLKGQGELSNLELDENVLTYVLDLPSWIMIKSASVNRVAIKIQWTKLKSAPICLYLDEVLIDMQTCEDLRKQQAQPTSQATTGKYGLTESIVDGMTVSINSVIINFLSPTFHASIQISRILVDSVTPLWAKSDDLRQTRLKDEARTQVIIFKEARWQTLRIEANALLDTALTTPLRLISNQSKLRISLKKRLIDCQMITSRLQLHLDDLLWVLTDTQLKAAIIFGISLNELINKARLQNITLVDNKDNTSVRTRDKRKLTDRDKAFWMHDPRQNSYHIHTGRVDVHLCDESDAAIKGGAMQLSLFRFELHFQPCHRAGGDRQMWTGYDENMATRFEWASDLIDNFKQQLELIKDCFKIADCKDKLLEYAITLKLQDFAIYRVSTPNQPKSANKKFIMSDKKQLMLPSEMSSLHIDFTEYYYFDTQQIFPIPSPNLFVLFNPIKIKVDYQSVLWLNSFINGLSRNLSGNDENVKLKEDTDVTHYNIKFTCLMPRLILPTSRSESTDNQRERPQAVQIQASKILLTNTQIEPKVSLQQLAGSLQVFKASKLFSSSTFPNHVSDIVCLPKIFFDHIDKNTDSFFDPNINALLSGRPLPQNGDTNLRSNTLHTKSKRDLWCLHIEQFWAEFIGVSSSPKRPLNFIEAFPLTIWLAMSPKLSSHQNYADYTILLNITHKIAIEINHYQYLFLLRLMETIQDAQEKLSTSNKLITNKLSSSISLTFSCAMIVREIEIAFVFPRIPELPPSYLDAPEDYEADRTGLKAVYDAVDARRIVHLNDKNGTNSLDNVALGHPGSSTPMSSSRTSTRLQIDDDIDEISSVRSGSDADDDYVQKVLTGVVEPAFVNARRMSSSSEGTISFGEEALDDMASVSSSIDRFKSIASISAIRILGAHMALHTKNDNLIVAATVDHLVPREYGNVSIESFQAKIISDRGAEADSFLPKRNEPPIKLRYQDSALNIQICDLDLKLSNSTISNLGDLFEDEKYAEKTFPIKIIIDRVKLTLLNDRPPTYMDTSPGATPLDLNISHAVIAFSDDRMININTMNNDMTDLRRRYNSLLDKHQSDVGNMLNEISRFKQENDTFRGRISHLERILSTVGQKMNMKSDGPKPWSEQLFWRIERLQQDGAAAVQQLAITTDRLKKLQIERDQLVRKLEQFNPR